jgi:hypothetical protein
VAVNVRGSAPSSHREVSTSMALPRNVIAFVHDHVDHVIKLDFILSLHWAPGGSASISLVARELDISKSQVRDMAHELVEAGLARVSKDRLELAPTSLDDRVAIADLASWSVRARSIVLDLLRALGRAPP